MMELIKEHWLKQDYTSLQNEIKLYAKSENDRKWAKKIANTNYEMLAVSTIKLNDFAKQIVKGNYLEFLSVVAYDYREDVVLTSKVIGLIKNFNHQRDAILKFLPHIDSWEGTDAIRFKITAKNNEKYFQFAKELLNSKLAFGRRLGVCILMKLIQFEEYVDEIFSLVVLNANEQEYYVNMCYAWLLCEGFIHFREKTMSLLKTKSINPFVLHKAISKCRDSFRIAKDDKKILKNLIKID